VGSSGFRHVALVIVTAIGVVLLARRLIGQADRRSAGQQSTVGDEGANGEDGKLKDGDPKLSNQTGIARRAANHV
jgi:hypothetical protein